MSTPVLLPQDLLLEKAKEYFDIRELVEPAVFSKWGETAWRFFDYRALHNLVFIRERIGKPITVNTWLWGGRFDERGLRTNISPIVKKRNGILYVSPHLRGAAFDFDVEDMTAGEVRTWILAHADELPFPCRLERQFYGKYISWVHMDVDFLPEYVSRVYLFDVG